MELKYKMSVLTLLLIPTNPPVEPRPTLLVAIPIKSSEILAAKTVCSSVNANVIEPSVETETAVPPFEE